VGLNHPPGKRSLEAKRAPRAVRRNVLGAQLEQEQIGHDGDRHRACNTLGSASDLMLPQPHDTFELFHEQLDPPSSQIDADNLLRRHGLWPIGHADVGLSRPIVTPTLTERHRDISQMAQPCACSIDPKGPTPLRVDSRNPHLGILPARQMRHQVFDGFPMGKFPRPGESPDIPVAQRLDQGQVGPGGVGGIDGGDHLLAPGRASEFLEHLPKQGVFGLVVGIVAAGQTGQEHGPSRPTVYAYLRRTTPPGTKWPQFQWTARMLTPYLPYLISRWRESGTDSMQLWREIRALGYTHSARTVCRFITQLRRASEAGLSPEAQASPYTRPQGPSPRAVSFTLMCPAGERSTEAQLYVEQLCQGEAAIARAHALIQAFVAMVRERRGHDLEAWMAEATDSVAELARFAQGLRDDLNAITAGLTLAWSNGVTDGQIHRLKLLKRQGYGRAGFALLRHRVLQAA
jgi:hypothetical protein